MTVSSTWTRTASGAAWIMSSKGTSPMARSTSAPPADPAAPTGGRPRAGARKATSVSRLVRVEDLLGDAATVADLIAVGLRPVLDRLGLLGVALAGTTTAV